ncbi:response regulator transcription factor [Variovorax terrae]|uniref:Response regulator transcription factor n=1 Tax=Variovorax terrae TaxID=2923278 RepID=A0A9X2API5_9BURK|nr:response regulator transcription factor [Variovorax terrae]MCJ0762081.1 response regulator transcription factor [Variovorax terrae]
MTAAADADTQALQAPAFPRPVLVVEDSAAMGERLRRILVSLGVPQADIVHAASLAQARQWLPTRPFQLALIDIGLPDGSGVDLIAALQRQPAPPASVVVSAWGDEDTLLAALRAGAAGYLLKEREDAEISLSLRSIQRGGAPIDPFIARRILSFVAQQAAAPEAPAAMELPPLSQRENEILRLVAQGLSNHEIAVALSLSKLTVESHTRNIYRKLAVGSRTEAVYEARRMGWLP